MKILKIKFRNIHSLKDDNTIDFTTSPLSDTGIFAIVGPTGAGKSTILDVIMLALFGQMPRLDDKISKDNIEKFGTVITRSTNEAFAEVEYSTNNKKYRSKWSIRRNRNGNLNDYVMEVADITESNEGKLIETYKSRVPEVNEKIIGLNYEQFLKSIILAQGSFSRFMKAKPEERTEMLEKITGTEIYRQIGKKAYDVAKRFEDIYYDHKSDLEKFEILNDDKINELTNSKNELENVIKKYNNEQKATNEKIKVKQNIDKLQKQIQELVNKQNTNEKEISDFEPLNQKLQLHNKLIVIKSDLLEHQNIKKNIADLKLKLEKSILKQQDLSKNFEIINHKIRESELSATQTKQEFELCKPFIEKSRILLKDVEIVENEHKIIIKNFEQLTKEFELINKQKQELSSKLTTLENDKVNVSEWLENNKKLSDLQNDYIVIEEALNNYADNQSKADKSIKNSTFSEQFRSIKWTDYQKVVSKIKEVINTKLAELSKENISSENIQELKSNYDKILSQLPLVEKQIELSVNYSGFDKKQKELNDTIKKISEELSELQKLSDKTTNQIELSAKLIEELKIKYEREQFEAKYEQDRQKLQENEPCPLCGSVHHPFVAQNYKQNIDKTKQQLKENEQFKAKLEKELTTYVSKISEKNSYLNSNQNILKEIVNQIETIKKQFDDNNKKTGQNFEINQKEKIDEYYKKISQSQNQTLQKIQTIENIEKYKNQLSEIQNLSDKIDNVLEFYTKAKSLLQKYKDFYPANTKPEDILKKLKIQSDLFYANNQQITQIEQNIVNTNNLLSEKNEQIEQKSSKIKADKENIENVKLKIQNLKSEILHISTENLKGKSADETEKYFNLFIEDLTKKINDSQNTKTKLETQITENKHIIEDFKLQISNYEADFLQKDNILASKLETFALKSIDEAFSGLLEENEAKKLENKKQELANQKLLINKTLNDTRTEYELEIEKDDKNISLETLLNSYEIAENAKNQANREIGSIITTLKNNDEQKLKFSELQKTIQKAEKDYLRWNALKNLIGSATGKVFAEIAQQFTLTELITLANVHLKNFSNRYILDKTGDTKNNLFVYDTYMGMSKRSVHTLSGGETFLVSLSMALALSDLASRKTKIESLFIDEGFGSLDEQTLDNALINLEKLHTNYNRTIGIISHIPEIKERISSKVTITKQNNGYSTLNIE